MPALPGATPVMTGSGAATPAAEVEARMIHGKPTPRGKGENRIEQERQKKNKTSKKEEKIRESTRR